MIQPQLARRAYEVHDVAEGTDIALLLKHQTCIMRLWDGNKHWTYFAIRGKFSNKCHDVVLPIKFSVFALRYSQWVSGEPAQEAFDMFSKQVREFIMTGTTEAEWNELMGGD